jgi:hypothetical protein
MPDRIVSARLRTPEFRGPYADFCVEYNAEFNAECYAECYTEQHIEYYTE